MQREAIESQADDFVTEFCRRHPNVNEAELRSELRAGPRWARLYLEECGVLDDFPRRTPGGLPDNPPEAIRKSPEKNPS